MARGVAFVGLPSDDERRIRAAIGTLTIAEHVPVPWSVCVVEQADLVIVALGSLSSQPSLAGSIRERGGVLCVLVGPADSVPSHWEKLSSPVRGHDLRNLLVSVDERARRGPDSDRMNVSCISEGAHGTHEHARSASLLDLAYVLREANESQSYACAWVLRGLGAEPLYVAPRKSALLFEGSLLTLRDRLIEPLRNDALSITRINELSLPRSVASKPLIMFQWLVGSLLDQKSLLPWIEPAGAYTLRHWPDFALLNHRPDHQRIATLLVNRKEVFSDILRLTQVDETVLIEFLNAASLTGRLVVSVPHTGVIQRSSDIGSVLLRRLRNLVRARPVEPSVE